MEDEIPDKIPENVLELNDFLVMTEPGHLRRTPLIVTGRERMVINTETPFTILDKSPVVLQPQLHGPTHWTKPMTLLLIHEYAERKAQVGETLKSQKKLFEIISGILNSTFNLSLNWLQVSNKWKSLERTYKEVIDNNNITGRRRKDFEFEEQLSAILGKRKNVNPDILLSEDAEIVTPAKKKSVETTNGSKDSDDPEPDETTWRDENAGDENETPRRPRKKLKTRVDVYEQHRLDRLAEAEQKKKRWEEKMKLQDRMVAAVERKNMLAKEKNEMLAALLKRLEK